jgi:Holliday junction resolvase RusA-like endonuclease
MTRSDAWNLRPAVASYWHYRDSIRLAAQKIRFQLKSSIDIVFLLPMPTSWSRKKKDAMRAFPHQQVPDTDNLLKAFCDALSDNDSHIWNQRGSKFWWDVGAIIVRENTDEQYSIKPEQMGVKANV